MADISKVTVGSTTYDIKDTTARAAAAAGFDTIVSTTAANTPEGVQWDNNGTVVTGTLAAADALKGIYLVKSATQVGTKDTYDEYVSASKDGVKAWEKIGDTQILLSNVVTGVTLNKSYATVLGTNTTFSNAESDVTVTPSTDTFVKSYPGVTTKLSTTTVTGTNGSISIPNVIGNTAVSATNTVFGTDTTASKVVLGDTLSATNLVLGTSTTASKATSGTAVSVAKAGSAVNVVTSVGGTSVLTGASVTDETLTLSSGSVTSRDVIPAVSNGTITPHTFADVTVPVVTSNTSVTIPNVIASTDVTVPVVTSNSTVSASKVTLGTALSAAVAGSAVTVATGGVSATGAGSSILTGLGTASTASAVTGITGATAAAQTLTVTKSEQTALTDDTSLTVTKGS